MTPPSISMRLLEGEPRPALDGWLRRRLLQRLAPLRHGALQLDDAWGSQRLGAPADAAPVRLRVDDARFYRALALGGSVGAGDAYGDGLWHSDDLVGLVRLLLRNRDLLDAMEAGTARLGAAALRAWHALHDNTRAGARRNIAAHYDLGNDFFGLFLSPDLM